MKSGTCAYATANVHALSTVAYNFNLILYEKVNGSLKTVKIAKAADLKSETKKLETERIELSENSEVYAVLWDDSMRPYTVKFNMNRI